MPLLVEIFDRQGVSFVTITQQFHTTTGIRRLTLNVLLSLAQFEREVIAEGVRDKIAASKNAAVPLMSEEDEETGTDGDAEQRDNAEPGSGTGG